jgi:competence protein ComEA
MQPLDRRLAALAAAALVAVLLAARWLGAGGEPVERVELGERPAAPRPADAQAGPGAGPGAAPAPGAPGAPGAAHGVWVHVAGAVRSPGLYRVPRDARVAQAVDLAGGPSRRADLTGVNLAAPLVDGQQVVVPVRGRAPGGGAAPSAGAAPPAGAAGGGASPGTPISLSTATLEQLDALDGIGPTLARRILEYRDAHGGFRSVAELREVDGIGEKRFEALREAVRP